MLATMTGQLWTAAPAWAHATVVSSNPVDGARLDVSPNVLSFDLNEPVSLVEGSAQLIDVDGVRHPLAAQTLEAGRQRIVLTPAGKLPDGAYLTTARVVSADTHVVSLSIRFTVGSVTEQGHWADADGQSAVDRAVVLPVKILVYVGTVASAGLLLARRWAWPDSDAPPRFWAVYRWGAGLLTAGLLGRFTVLATEQAGGSSAVSWSALTTIAATPFGRVLIAAAALSVIVWVRPPAGHRSGRVLGVLQAAAAVGAVALGGHGASTGLWPLPFVLTYVHVYAVAVWLGGITALTFVCRTVPQLDRWHRVAIGHVGLLAAAGLGLAILQVRPVAALFTTSYGLVLIAKIALVSAVLAAAYAAYRAYRARPKARPPTVLVEAGLALLVIGATSALSSLTPARDSYTTNVATRLDFGAAEVLDVDIDTVRRGSQVVTVGYRGAPGDPTPELGVELSSVQANVARLPVKLSHTRAAEGAVTWHSDGLIVPAPGRWKVTVRFDDGAGPKLASFFYEVL